MDPMCYCYSVWKCTIFLFVFCISIVRPYGRVLCFQLFEHKPALCYNVCILFLCHFLIFPHLHFQFLQNSHLSLLFCVEKQLQINVRQQSTHIHANMYQSYTACTYHLLIIFLYCTFKSKVPLNQQFFCLPVKPFCLLYIMPARYYLSVLFSVVAQYMHLYNIANQMHSFADDRWTEKTTI